MRFTFCFAITLCVLAGNSSQAGVIPLTIRNASFEDGTVPADGDFYSNDPAAANAIPEWRERFEPVVNTTGLFNPSTADIDNSIEPAPPSGDVVAFLHGVGGFLSQDLLAPGGGFLSLQVGDQISVSVFAHDRATVGGDSSLHVGIRDLANVHVALFQSQVVSNETGYDELTYNFTVHTATPSAFLILSKPGGGSQINLDTVSATFSAVPEPSTFALLGIGGFGFAARRFRRRKSA